MAALLRAALAPHVLRTALSASVVVGTVLNAINYGGDILAGTWPEWPRIAMNFLVPYLVASYSGARSELARRG